MGSQERAELPLRFSDLSKDESSLGPIHVITIPLMSLKIEIASALNDVLSRHGINAVINAQEISVTENTVSDGVLGQKLSSAIVDALWPSIHFAKVYHYTTFHKGENILKSGCLRLNNIERRYCDSEIRSFCETHQLTGYLVPGENGDPTYRSLIMPNTFYTSFTTTELSPEDEEYFWNNFAGSDGFRLTFEVTATNQDFRKMLYQKVDGEPIHLLADIVTLVRERFDRQFYLSGLSRLCSFYLPGSKYSREKEYRLLYRIWDDSGPQQVGCGRESYIEMPFSIPTAGYTIKITQVCGNDQPRFKTGVPFVFRQ